MRKKKKNKKIILYSLNILLTIFVLIFLTGCEEKESKVTSVTFWHAMGGPLGDALGELVNEFNLNHSNIKIESISMGNYNALSQKIIAGILSHKTPTIAQVYSSWTSNLYESNVIEPLENYINGKNGLSEEELSDFYPVFIKDNTFDEKLITLPFNKSVYNYYYNIDLFKRAGIDSFPKTWSSLLETALKLQKDEDPITAFGVSVGIYESVLYSFGGKIVDDNNNPSFYSEEGIKALQYLKDLIYEYRLAHLTTGYQHQDEFIAEKIAFIVGTSVSYAFIMRSDPEFRVGVAPMPKEDTTGVIIMGTNVALFEDKNDKEKNAAWEFIKWLVAPEQQAEWAIKTGYVPVRKSTLELPEVKEHFKKVPGLKKVWEQLIYAELEPSDPAWLFGRQIFSQVGLEPVLRGGMDVKENLRLAEEEVKITLRR